MHKFKRTVKRDPVVPSWVARCPRCLTSKFYSRWEFAISYANNHHCLIVSSNTINCSKPFCNRLARYYNPESPSYHCALLSHAPYEASMPLVPIIYSFEDD